MSGQFMICPDGAGIALTSHLHHQPSVRSKRYAHRLGIVDKAGSPKGIEHNEAGLVEAGLSEARLRRCLPLEAG